jgi:hypothetical protein
MAKHYLYNTTFKQIKSSRETNKNPVESQLSTGILSKSKSIEDIVQEGIDNGDIVAGTSFTTADGLKLTSGVLDYDFSTLTYDPSPDFSMDKILFYSEGDMEYRKMPIASLVSTSGASFIAPTPANDYTVNYDYETYYLTLQAATTPITLSNIPAGRVITLLLLHAAANRLVTFPGSTVKFPGGTFNLSTVAFNTDSVSLLSLGTGTFLALSVVNYV